jgi:hypothetical protein
MGCVHDQGVGNPVENAEYIKQAIADVGDLIDRLFTLIAVGHLGPGQVGRQYMPGSSPSALPRLRVITDCGPPKFTPLYMASTLALIILVGARGT